MKPSQLALNFFARVLNSKECMNQNYKGTLKGDSVLKEFVFQFEMISEQFYLHLYLNSSVFIYSVLVPQQQCSCTMVLLYLQVVPWYFCTCTSVLLYLYLGTSVLLLWYFYICTLVLLYLYAGTSVLVLWYLCTCTLVLLYLYFATPGRVSVRC